MVNVTIKQAKTWASEHLLLVIPFAFLGVLAYYHYQLGRDTRMYALYIIPVVLSLRFSGFKAGIITTVIATLIRLELNLGDPDQTVVQVVWNTCMVFCTLFLICNFIHRLEDLLTTSVLYNVFDRALILTLALSFVLGVLCYAGLELFYTRELQSPAAVTQPSKRAQCGQESLPVSSDCTKK